MKRKPLLLLLILIALLTQVGVAFAVPDTPIVITIDQPRGASFHGFTADIDENGRARIHTYTDPGVFAAVNGLSISELTDQSSDEGQDQISVNGEAPQTSKTKGKASKIPDMTINALHQAKVSCYSQILDSVNIVMNQLYNSQTFNYDFSYVRSSSGTISAWPNSNTGWYILSGPTMTWGNSLPARSESLKGYASYQNNSWPGSPYKNAITNYTFVYSDGSVNASHTFYVDSKGSYWGWKTKGWYTRTQNW